MVERALAAIAPTGGCGKVRRGRMRPMADGSGDDSTDDVIGRWLLDQGLRDASAEDIVKGYCERLTADGVALHRAVLGGMILHPNFGAMNVVWEADSGETVSELVGRELLSTEAFQNTPFFQLVRNPVPFKRHRLDGDPAGEWYPVFDRLKAAGITEYLLFSEPYSRVVAPEEAQRPVEGVLLSLSTRRAGGFTAAEVARLRALTPAFALAVKTATMRRFTEVLLRTYVGPFSGKQVLDGAIERGAGREIDCVLFYCDLRNSTRLAAEMELDAYLALLNGYFDCTAGAVTAHGGEVLKFIGDAVMAIFPVDGGAHPAVEMRRAAIAAAREALMRRDRLRAAGVALDFGVGLHAGKVKYGNVGTADRLDFTVIGPPVNLVARLEGLTKTLGAAVIVSATFLGDDLRGMRPLGAHKLVGVAEPVDVYGLD
jgi:adenylate cyclase